MAYSNEVNYSIFRTETATYLNMIVQTLAQAWGEGVQHVFFNGHVDSCQLSSSQKVELTKDVTALIVVERPLSKPRIARPDLFGNASLRTDYLAEVLDGSKDDKIGVRQEINGEDVITVPYTYHNRLRNYSAADMIDGVDQIEGLVDILKESPNSRRAQAITWQPEKDLGSSDPPCLQSLWGRVIGEGENQDKKLDLHVRFRSNDLFKAFGANHYAFTELQSRMSDELGCGVGDYCYQADSLHIYESDWGEPDKERLGEPNVSDVIHMMYRMTRKVLDDSDLSVDEKLEKLNKLRRSGALLLPEYMSEVDSWRMSD